jgi:OOP family OmpA-OmpF porin
LEEEINMADSMFNSLLNMVDSRAIGDVSQSLGAPTQAVSRAMEPTIAALLSGLAAKSDNPGTLRQILDSVSSAAGRGSWSSAVAAASDPNSSLMTTGKRLLSALFGGGENVVTNGISRASGLSPGATGTLLTMAAPLVMGFISKHVSETGVSMNALGSLLQRESSSFRSALPSGLSEIFWPAKTTAATASPVVAQAVQKETSSSWLLPAVAAAGLALGLIWLFGHARRPVVSHIVVVPRGDASRFATPAPNLACTLPAGVTLPEGGTASRLLAVAQNPAARLGADTWINTDSLLFDSGSATPKPGSQTELNNIATVLTSCPNVRMTIAGHTDSSGNPEANLRLSRSRANAVMAQLENRGISADRLTAEGFGQNNPVADENTAEGRAQNRRVAILVTQR